MQRILAEAPFSGRQVAAPQSQTSAVQRQGIEEYEKTMAGRESTGGGGERSPADDQSDRQRWGHGQSEGEISWWDSRW